MKKLNAKKVKEVAKTIGYWTLVVLAIVAITVLTVAAGVVLVVAALVSVIAAFIARVLLYGLIGSLLSWFTWTYMGLGALYFPGLDPVYLSIPFLHFFLVWSTLILLLRQLRKPTYGKVDVAGLKKLAPQKKTTLKVVK